MKKIIGLSAALVLVMVLGLLVACGGSYTIPASENVALASLRLAAAESRLDGSGELTQAHFNMLGQLVRNADSSNEWFAGASGTFYAGTQDTADRQVTFITDGTWTATFYTEDANAAATSHRLVEYTFVQRSVTGHRISITD